MLRAPRTLMALLLLVVGVVAPAATSTAAGGACPDANGVTVVVDFRSLGGEMIVRCAVGEIDDGFHALRAAGIDHDQPVRFPGMVCRVEDLPADEPCQGAPPADRYWGYWHADHGGDWTYANKGPGGRTPAPGSAEGWAFFSTAAGDAEAMPPRMAPPTHAAAAAASPSPTPTPTPSPTPDPDVVSPSPPAPTPSTGPTEPQPPATPNDQPIEPTPSPAGTPAATPSTAPSDPATASPTTTPSASATETATAAPSESVSAMPDDSASPDDEPSTDPVSAPADGGGPSAATIVGILLILALAVAAGITARRRRTA